MFVRKVKPQQQENKPTMSPPSLSDTPQAYLKAHSSQSNLLVVSAAVFHKDRLLIIQRAENERSWPSCWEMPGGSAEPSDKTVRDALARELFEETGLRMTEAVKEVLPVVTFTTGWVPRERKWLKITFVVEVEKVDKADGKAVRKDDVVEKLAEEARMNQLEEELEVQDTTRGTEESAAEKATMQHLEEELEVDSSLGGTKGDIANMYEKVKKELPTHSLGKDTTSTADDVAELSVKVDPKEHQAFMWATEQDIVHASVADDIRSGALDRPDAEGIDKDGEESKEKSQSPALTLVTEDQRRVMLEAFRLHREH
ncbi:hypothetical protein M8818_002916 [Zalaria obscura]|uniref:Uncharacterized protein n=1 Tax=Zalaria obscura TaxID=2024903 RepID=A0ACC3SLP8_9PEZI